eukprot:981750-Alexandrium_andersonii.AAC.1
MGMQPTCSIDNVTKRTSGATVDVGALAGAMAGRGTASLPSHGPRLSVVDARVDARVTLPSM